MNKRLKFILILLVYFLDLYDICDAGLISNVILNQKESEFSKFVCDVVKDVVSKNREISTASMATFENNFDEVEIDKMLKCLPKRLKLMITDFRLGKPETADNVKSSIVIIVADTLDMTKFNDIISAHQSIGGLNHMAKFLIITSDKNSQIARISSSLFPQLGIIDFGLIYLTDSQVFVEVSNHFRNTTNVYSMISLTNATSLTRPKVFSERIFPDKLKNLHGYSYRILHHIEMPYAHYIRFIPRPVAKNHFFFDSVAKVQNASVNYVMIETVNRSIIQHEVTKLMHGRQIDITISESEMVNKTLPTVITYDEKTICAMIPENMLFDKISIMAFNRSNVIIQIFILASVLSIAIVWRLYKKHGAVDSVLHLQFAIFGSLMSQHIALSSQNRTILKIMMQILLIMMIFLRFIYEGTITSKTIDQNTVIKYETVLDVLSDEFLNVTTHTSVESLVKHIQENESSKKNKLEVAKTYSQPIEDMDKYVKQRTVILGCDYLDHYIRTSRNNKNYLLPNYLHLSYLRLYTDLLSPFTKQFQQFMDYSFNTGLTQKWEVMYLTELFGSRSRSLKSLQVLNENKQYLTYNDLKPLFLICLSLYGISVLIFLCEILQYFCKRISPRSLIMRTFTRKSQSQTSSKSLLDRIRKFVCFQRQNEAMNIRRIQVKPINVQESPV